MLVKTNKCYHILKSAGIPSCPIIIYESFATEYSNNKYKERRNMMSVEHVSFMWYNHHHPSSFQIAC